MDHHKFVVELCMDSLVVLDSPVVLECEDTTVSLEVLDRYLDHHVRYLLEEYPASIHRSLVLTVVNYLRRLFPGCRG